MPSFETIDDYIRHQPKEAQKILTKLRSIIKEAVPESSEVPNYKVPTFTLVPDGKKEQQIMIAGYAKFVSFYPFPATMDRFSEELVHYKKGKGSIQFPFDTPLPKDLIMRMVQFRRDEILKDWK